MPQDTPKYRFDIEPGIIAWIVGADTVDNIPDRIVMNVANDPMAVAMLKAGYPVVYVEDIRGVN